MSNDILIKKGLDLKINGVAVKETVESAPSQIYSIFPTDLHTVIPKLLVKEGAEVKTGEIIFFSKYDESVKFASPVSGKIIEIKRGERRVILEIRILADATDVFVNRGAISPSKMSDDEVKKHLLESGCWPFIKQRPYDVLANSNEKPKAIFISAYASAPLATDFEYALKDKLVDFQTGIDALAKLTDGKVHLSVNGKVNSIFSEIQGAQIHKIHGPHPAGNVGVQVSKIDPVNQGERVWTIAADDVAIIGHLFNTGHYNPTKTMAVAGSELKNPSYCNLRAGASVKEILKNQLASSNVRIISGDILTGKKISEDGFIGFYSNMISVLPEGNQYRMFGWMPFAGADIHSMQRTALSWLTPNKKYTPNTNLNGEERALVVTGEMEKVMPIDIYPMQLIKACLAKDIDKMENLGIYEVAPEDFALVDYANTSKIEAQTIIREALDLMIKEVG